VPKLPVTGVVAFAIGVLLTACSASRNNSAEPVPVVRIGLSQRGLPKDFFQADADTKCSHQIIGYRFVVWLDKQTVAVGFNTSPNCRPSPDQKVHGVARILVFDAQGTFKASRDLPYDADGGKVLVAGVRAALALVAQSFSGSRKRVTLNPAFFFWTRI